MNWTALLLAATAARMKRLNKDAGYNEETYGQLTFKARVLHCANTILQACGQERLDKQSIDYLTRHMAQEQPYYIALTHIRHVVIPGHGITEPRLDYECCPPGRAILHAPTLHQAILNCKKAGQMNELADEWLKQKEVYNIFAEFAAERYPTLGEVVEGWRNKGLPPSCIVREVLQRDKQYRERSGKDE
jgi:hypothetical protein